MWAFLRETPYQRDEIVLRHQGECILTNGYGKIYEVRALTLFTVLHMLEGGSC